MELNEAGREILKLPRESHGESFESVFADAPDFRALLTEVLGKRVVAGRREVSWRQPDEAERILGVTATPAEGADGRFLGAVALFSDLTEIRKLEGRVALVRHLADLGQVSAGAAHEFRNAAAAIDGYADLALRSNDAGRSAEYVRAIRHEAQEMSRVTSDFLLFARPEGFVPEPVDLAEVAEAAAAETEHAYPGVAVAKSGEFAPVSGSAVLLRRAVANLLRNAVEATPEDRRAGPEAIALWGGRGPAGSDAGGRRSRRGRGCRRARKDLPAVLLLQARRIGIRPGDRGADRRAARRDGRDYGTGGRRRGVYAEGAGGLRRTAHDPFGFGSAAIIPLKLSLSIARSSASPGSTMPCLTSSVRD